MSFVPLGEDGRLGPSMRWWWYPKAPLKGFATLTLPKTKIPILKSRPVTEREIKLTGVYRACRMNEQSELAAGGN